MQMHLETGNHYDHNKEEEEGLFANGNTRFPVCFMTFST